MKQVTVVYDPYMTNGDDGEGKAIATISGEDDRDIMVKLLNKFSYGYDEDEHADLSAKQLYEHLMSMNGDDIIAIFEGKPTKFKP